MSQELAVPELTVEQRAIAAIGFDEAKANEELTELAGQSKDLLQVTNEDSYKQIQAARMVLKNRRIEIEKRAKAAREDATKFSRTVIEVEKRLVGLIQPEEQRLEKIQQDHNDAEDREREAKILAEQKRVEDIQEHISDIRKWLELCTRYDTPAETIEINIKDLSELEITDERFQEFRSQADEVKTAVLTKLREAHTAAVAREEEKREAAKAQAELAKLRAEQAAREAKERSEREERERQEREKREAEEKAAREKLAAEQAEVARKQKIENDRIAAENKRLADERAAFEAEQAEAKRKADEAERSRLAAEEAERKKKLEAERLQREADEAERKRKEEAEKLARKSKYPGEALIVDTLAKHFGVTDAVVRSWLVELRKAA